ncbi:DUF1778 domain-containing protein [uncultured Alsobacter sp.]|uniref:type II toxin-antitoxin system TacA family antitoxin n=1 Tax=uncultured Alsobacter sp. TaxID=1748258 RepID=UPI0025FB9140|nr:DUF1778 domain-containing protein [uncultured Alsobacter sp.]
MAQSKTQRDGTVRGLINLRVSERDRQLIDQAAASTGQNRSEFMLNAAREAAQQALLDRVLFRTDAETFDQLLRMLDEPPAPAPELRKLMGMKPPWEP